MRTQYKSRCHHRQRRLYSFTGGSASALTFTAGFKKSFVSGGKFTETEILNNVHGDKTGYTLKEINNISPTGIVNLSSDKKSLSFIKVGSFTATLVLKHSAKADATINGRFTIEKGASQSLGFDKLTLPYQQTISKARLEQNITGKNKNGYTVKSIGNINPRNAAELSGTDLKIKKAGDFTARLTLAHDSYGDVIVTAHFTIQKGASKKLGFSKLTSNQNLITKEAILKNVNGDKNGYMLKSISAISDSDVASLTGRGLQIKKAGRFTATLTLAHAIYADVTLTGAQFEIKFYSFTKLVTPYKKAISKAEIEKQVKGLAGYTLKSIATISDSAIAALTGSAQTALYIKKIGLFTATLTLEKRGEADLVLRGAAFQITKAPAQKLIFKKLVVSGRLLITKADILKRIPEKDRAGYTLKALTGLREISGGPGIADIYGLSIRIKKPVGIFTADLVLQHPNYLDTTITGATFEKKDQVYVFDEKTGTISGVMASYKTYFTFTPVKDEFIDVTFPDQINGVDVVEIKGDAAGNNVFGNDYSNQNLSIKTIYLPKNLKVIGDKAFQYCTRLASITIPDKVTSIGHSAFYGCNSLASITIPNKVTSIGSGAFQGCSKLASITLSNTLTSIGGSAFYKCTSLASITIPNKVTSIGGSAFEGCIRLASVTLSDSLTSIGSRAFEGCSKLASITLPNTLTSIGNGAFSSCSSLASITIPDKVTRIEYEAFQDCTSLASVKLHDKVTHIEYEAFWNCTSLASVTLSGSLEWIKTRAFKGCTSLKAITIPISVKVLYIIAEAFEGCTSLVVTIKEPDPTKIDISINSFGHFSSKNTVKQIRVPAMNLGTYQAATDWTYYSSIMVGYW